MAGGVAAGLLIAAIVIQAGRRDLIAPVWRQVIPVAGAALAYGIAVGPPRVGLHRGVRREAWHFAWRSSETLTTSTTNSPKKWANVLNGVTFVLSGAILLGPALGELTWELVLYAVLSLTLLRMLPVAIARWGSRAKAPTVGFLGWFGPRGLASIVFAVIVIEESQLPHEHLIALAIYTTVGASVLAHGLSAAPLAGRYARWFERHPRDKAPLDGEPSRAEGQNSRPRTPKALGVVTGASGLARTSPLDHALQKARLDRHTPGRPCLTEGVVVALVLVGVGLGERGQRPVEGSPAPR